MEDQYDGDSIIAKTNWDYNKHGRIIKEHNNFIFDSSIYQMHYKWKDSHLLEKYAEIETTYSNLEFTTKYDTLHTVESYNYRSKRSGSIKKLSFTILRDDQKRATRIIGVQNEKPFEIKFNYEGAMTTIDLLDKSSSYKIEDSCETTANTMQPPAGETST